jgi:fibro-slime domain-containing protein
VTVLGGLTALSLLVSCGAGGEAGNLVTERDAQGNPILGGGGAPGDPRLIVPSCEGSICDLATGQVITPPGCGDGALTPDEACDDGNLVSGDGCSETCLLSEPGFSCAVPGQACQRIARCGDGLVAPSEQCDDANLDAGDGCSSRCRVELGKKCEGDPSVCTDTTCGDNLKEGAEACDDGNTRPFDGCSPICLKEPNCEGLSCVSDCGDGLLINEDCDDGNLIDGDGCSSSCTVEGGFTCVAEAACELIGEQCALRVPAVFRDFSSTHPDFTNNTACTALVPGTVADELDANGRPVLSGANTTQACLSTAENFAQWYTDRPDNVTVVGEIVLFDNGKGGYVNRFGAEGQPFQAVDPTTERGGGASLAACENQCLTEARNGNAPFDGPLRCDDLCRPITDDIQQLTVGQLNQLNNQLTQAQNAAVPDPVVIADLEAEIALVEAELAELGLQATTCQTGCETELAARVAPCAATCKPCSSNPAQFCLGGVTESYDGSPLFFPVDGVTTGPTSNLAAASIPAQYGYNAFPLESAIFPGAPNHNFYFTSEVQYWFQYDAATQATLDFLGDDDVWVFLNGKLAVDLGGIHVPSSGSLTIDAAAGQVTSEIQDGREPVTAPIVSNATPDDFGLVEGGVYTITIFHAERQLTGSSFKLTLAGFEATPSECTAICGDGVLSFGEECDDGVNDGGYGECGTSCVLGPFCGDGIQQSEAGETCDPGPGGDPGCRGCRSFEIR